MQIFKYPYVIITILVFGFLLVGAFGLYFVIKFVHTANGTEEKGLSGLSSIKNDFEKLTKRGRNRCLYYIYVSVDSASRVFSESKALRIRVQLADVLLAMFSDKEKGRIAMNDEENFIALSECRREHAVECIERCLADMNQIILESEAVNTVSVKFGFCCTSSTQVTFDTVLNRAKQACSMAENENIPYVEWDSNNGKAFAQKIKIENSIHNEIDNNRFFLEYQPIIDAKTGGIVGAEVLARLNSASDGILRPNAFLSAVNNVGLNEKFDYYIFEKNCKWIANQPAQREQYFYTINFSRSTLCEEGFAKKVIAIAEKYNLKHSSLAIEILEDKELTRDEKQQMMKNLTILKENGFSILLDDFGKGYTSFTDLDQFVVNIVKIDKEITQNAISRNGFFILKNIIQTAKDLGYTTLCEGVETEEQQKIVTEAGCDFLQGYYFYRPMPVLELEKLFEKNDIVERNLEEM